MSDFEVLEIVVDHYISGGPALREAIVDIAGRIPVVAHGVGLSIGTAVRPDGHYLDRVAEVIELTRAPWYSEHLAFTKIPTRDLAQLIPLPRTPGVAEVVLRNLEVVRKHIRVPTLLENITYYFDYPHSELDEIDFLTLVLRESGASLLLDVENLFLNACNHGYDPYAFLDRLPGGTVKGIHVAGGVERRGLLIDSHDRPVPDPVLSLLGTALARHSPDSVILERDRDLDRFDEVLADVRRLKAVVEP